MDYQIDELASEVVEPLRKAAHAMRVGIKRQDFCDVLQDAIVNALQRVDALAAGGRLVGQSVISACIYRACQDALRAWIDSNRKAPPTHPTEWFASRRAGKPVARYSFIGQLPDGLQAVAEQLAGGSSQRQTAENLGLSMRQTRKQIHELRRILGPEQSDR